MIRGRRALLINAAASVGLAKLLSVAEVANAQSPRRRMPVIFVGHGSPMNAISDNPFTRALKAWGAALSRPSAILSVSAHWLTPGKTLVTLNERPETIHDFGGFPRELHEMQYPAPGAPLVARQAALRVQQNPAEGTEQWGLDHGTWTVLHHMFPKADVPVFQLSIDYAKPAAFHHAVGRELSALRDQGVLIMGSGNVVHNLRATDRQAPAGPSASRPWAQSFDDAFKSALAGRDDKALMNYSALPAAEMAVATPDHYFPVLYPLGAAGSNEAAKTVFEGFHSGTLSMRCLQFG